MLVSQFLSKNIDNFAEKEVLICPEGRFLYRDIGERVKKFSNLLINNNLKKSDRAIIFLENSLESVVSIFGILESGGVFIVINTQVKPKKLEYIINDSGANILITDKKHLENIKDILKEFLNLKTIIIVDEQK
jgi:acyl-CoA synthetase (AMP-forming)/AMP-acid ligase II